MNIEKIARKVCDFTDNTRAMGKSTEKEIQEVANLIKQGLKEEMFGLAAIWEETGKRSISLRIRTTLQHCADELRKML